MSVDTVITIGFGLYLYTGFVLITFMVALELALKPQTTIKDVSLWGAALLCVFLWPFSVYEFPEAIREWKESR